MHPYQGFQQVQLVLRQGQTRPVHPLCLADLIQSQVQQHRISLGRETASPLHQIAAFFSEPMKPRLKPQYSKLRGFQVVQGGFQLGGIDPGGAGTLVARCLGEIADHCKGLRGIQGQDGILVL